jgi:hypothetical protein
MYLSSEEMSQLKTEDDSFDCAGLKDRKNALLIAAYFVRE